MPTEPLVPPPTSVATVNVSTTAELNLDKAVFGFADAYARLWASARAHPLDFPQTVIGCGSIAEYYALIYLRTKHPNMSVCFSQGGTKGFDIEARASNSECIKYQVKSISPFNKARRLNALTRGFDKLIVLSLSEEFFPDHVYLFEDSSAFFMPGQGRILTVPDGACTRRTGSRIFSHSKNILDEFLASLE